MTTTESKPTLMSDCEKIRKAWNAGQKEITLNGHKLVIRKETKHVTFHDGDKTIKRDEHWLIASPANGDMVPLYSCEPKKDANLRTAT